MKEAKPHESGQSKSDINFSKLSAIKALPPFPTVASKLLTVIADEDADFRQVSQLIMTDTACPARYFGSQTPPCLVSGRK